MKCNLCQTVFTKEEASTVCKSCPLNPMCSLVKCPNCGNEYGMYEEDTVIPLIHLPVGDKGVITSICLQDETVVRKIVAFGFLPGINVHMKQKNPTLRVQFGNADFALDTKIAKNILVRCRTTSDQD